MKQVAEHLHVPHPLLHLLPPLPPLLPRQPPPPLQPDRRTHRSRQDARGLLVGILPPRRRAHPGLQEDRQLLGHPAPPFRGPGVPRAVFVPGQVHQLFLRVPLLRGQLRVPALAPAVEDVLVPQRPLPVSVGEADEHIDLFGGQDSLLGVPFRHRVEAEGGRSLAAVLHRPVWRGGDERCERGFALQAAES